MLIERIYCVNSFASDRSTAWCGQVDGDSAEVLFRWCDLVCSTKRGMPWFRVLCVTSLRLGHKDRFRLYMEFILSGGHCGGLFEVEGATGMFIFICSTAEEERYPEPQNFVSKLLWSGIISSAGVLDRIFSEARVLYLNSVMRSRLCMCSSEETMVLFSDLIVVIGT